MYVNAPQLVATEPWEIRGLPNEWNILLTSAITSNYLNFAKKTKLQHIQHALDDVREYNTWIKNSKKGEINKENLLPLSSFASKK